MYVDPITRQTFEYANQIPCENNPQNVISLDPDADQYYVLTQPIKKDPPLFFEPTEVQAAISPNTFTAQDAGIYSQKELKHFWNRVLFTKYSDNTTLQLLGKAISYEFMSKQSSALLPDNPYRSLRIGLHDYMLNLTPFSSPDWFTDAFNKLFVYPLVYPPILNNPPPH